MPDTGKGGAGMIRLQGKGISAGIAEGPVHFFRHADKRVTKGAAANPAQERERLRRAQDQTIGQLEQMAECCRKEAGEESALLFQTHALLVEDEDYVACIHELLEKERCAAEYAVQQTGEAFAEMLAAMEDVYMQERAADIRDVSRRLISNLMGAEEHRVELAEPAIIAADELAPSETIQLDKRMILGFMLRRGSASSHTAILARTMGIPAICGLGDRLEDEHEGVMACMDGETGEVVLAPDEAVLDSFREQQRCQQEQQHLWQSLIGQEDVTPDGRRMHIYCNIGAPEDLPAVLASDAQGIGLFRSEFLYLAAKDFPDEETQFNAYRTVVSAMAGKRVIIRTLDVGADKQAACFRLVKEENPALGMRGIRICLNQPEVFRTQLRALYRASAYGRIGIMFPMIASVWEVQECRRACRQVMEELEKEGIPFKRDTEIGVMIETPAAVLIAPELAREVDFFSVGTNDLTQYLLACDRQSGDLDRFFDPCHPAVLRALQMAADAAHRAGIWIGVCGDLAADKRMLPTFLSMGIDELSVPPSMVLALRGEVRGCGMQRGG